MTLAILDELEAAGVVLYLAGDRLRFRAPAGVMTPERRAKAKAHEAELFALLAAPVTIAPEVGAPERPGEGDTDTDRLAAFLARVDAELSGVYCTPLEWPENGEMLADPGAHWDAYGGHVPDYLAEVLRPIAEAWRASERPIGDGLPLAAGLYQWEYSRLVAWHEADPDVLSQQIEAWEGSITLRRNPLADPLASNPLVGAYQPRKLSLETRSERPPLFIQLEALQPSDLPESFTLRPGVTVTDGAAFLSSLKTEAALGLSGLRARRGLLESDVSDLLRAIAGGECRQAVGSVSAGFADAEVPTRIEGKSPADHIAELGGFTGVADKLEPGTAHLLWDAARLWERDQGSERAERWEAQYWLAWVKSTGPTRIRQPPA